jgi:hypothetical protein
MNTFCKLNSDINYFFEDNIMKLASKNLLTLAISSIAFCFSAAVSADNFNGFDHGHGHPSSITQLVANLTDSAVPPATGRGAIKWTSDSRRGTVSIEAGITIPVDSSYGIADSNAAVATPVTLTITHGIVTYSCNLNISDLYFNAPIAPSTTYLEYANYDLLVSQRNGVQDNKYFGSCSTFPTALSPTDTVSVTINGSALTGILK